tara:strand:+ start:84 stop:1352 length:1269 start_codon:yes stop_codon:yes gene_type:complete
MNSPLPSLLPYIGFILILLLTAKSYQFKNNFIFKNNNKINLMISIYVILVIFQGIWQTGLGFISVGDLISSLIIYLFPISFYIYFSRYAIEKEIHIVLIVMIITGLISGLYFIYDSYLMLVFGEVSDFSIKMIEYSTMRATPDNAVNDARIAAFNRSHGLLENHAVSASWISISCFAMLALLPKKETLIRFLVIILYSIILLIALNFTSIIAFSFIILFIELKGFLLFKALIAKSSLKALLVGMIAFVMAYNFNIQNQEGMAIIIRESIIGQIKLMTGNVEYKDNTFFYGFIISFVSFAENMLSFPPGILIGEGFSSWGSNKGGDFGHAETLHQLGLPFYVAVIIGLFKLIKLSLYKIQILNLKIHAAGSYLYFAVCVLLYILIATIHYSIWSTKSILPIFFISIAFISRFLPSQTNQYRNK